MGIFRKVSEMNLGFEVQKKARDGNSLEKKERESYELQFNFPKFQSAREVYAGLPTPGNNKTTWLKWAFLPTL